MTRNDERLNPILHHPAQPKDGTAGIERPLALLDHIAEDPRPLLELVNRPIVSARQFDRATLAQIFRLAAQFETTPSLVQAPLSGKILISAFYEPSTRTRLSFESAWHRLGGDIMSITDRGSTGIAKGETLYDIGEMFNNYGDVVVLRDNADSSVYEMLDGLRIPIVNAGNGVDEHPTQALADLYAIFKWRPELLADEVAPEQRIRIGVVGVPNRMRTVRSLLLLLSRYAPAIDEVVVFSRDEGIFDEGQREELQEHGLSIRTCEELEPELPGLDVVYINAIAWVGDSFETHGMHYALSAASPLKPGAIILHPLARGDELAVDLDATPHNWYFAQARGAVFVRMALLTSLVNRIGQVMDAPAQSLL